MEKKKKKGKNKPLGGFQTAAALEQGSFESDFWSNGVSERKLQ